MSVRISGQFSTFKILTSKKFLTFLKFCDNRHKKIQLVRYKGKPVMRMDVFFLFVD